MGWANCGTDDLGRQIGYAHDAGCDHKGCDAEIHRGLAYVCGTMHGGEDGCGRYFCGPHKWLHECEERDAHWAREDEEATDG